MTMKGIFVNETGGICYAKMLVQGYKTIETRNRNMLRHLVGERVAVIRTQRDQNPLVLGYITIESSSFCKADDFHRYDNQHCVPVGSRHDCQNGKGKWFYHVTDAETCQPYPLPHSAVRHGRSWAEWDDITDAMSWSEAAADTMTDDEWSHLHDGEEQKHELF